MGGELILMVVLVAVASVTSVGAVVHALIRRRADGSPRRWLALVGSLGMFLSALSAALLCGDRRWVGSEFVVGFCVLIVLLGARMVQQKVAGRRSIMFAMLGLVSMLGGLLIGLPTALAARRQPQSHFDGWIPRLYAYVPITWVIDDIANAMEHDGMDILAIERMDAALSDPRLRQHTIRLIYDRAISDHARTGRPGTIGQVLIWDDNDPGLTDDEMRRLLRASVESRLFVPPKMAHGSTVRFAVVQIPAPMQAARTELQPEIVTATLNGIAFDRISKAEIGMFSWNADGTSLWRQLAEGDARMELLVRTTIRYTREAGHTLTETVESTLAAQTLVADPAEVFAPLVEPTPADHRIKWSALLERADDKSLSVRVIPDADPSAPLHGRVLIRHGDHQQPIAYERLERSKSAVGLWVDIPADRLPTSPFVLVFEPDPTAPAGRLQDIDLTPVLNLPFSVTVDPVQP